jgi:hypothetical protein
MYPRQIFMAAISAGALVISAGYAFAAPIAPDLEIIDEDKRFFNFTCSVVSNGNTSGGCETVNVTALTGDTGLRFQDFFVSFSGPVNSALDVLITYDVQVLDPTQSIESISLGFNGTANGLAFTNVVESAFDADGNLVGQAEVLTPPPTLQTEVVLDSPQQFLHIVKDIGLVSFASEGTTSTATISFIDQDFHQTGDEIPEPATLALFGAGLMGLGLLRRRKAA